MTTSRPLPLARAAGQKLTRPWRLQRLRVTYADRIASPPLGAYLRGPRIELCGLDELPKALRAPAESLIAEASHVRQHEVDYLGSGLVSLGDPIEWHTDVKSGYQWSPDFYQDVQVTRLDDESDAKFPWELSRCHHLLTLARAATLCEEESYATELEAQLWSWLEDNPVGHGINWTNPMEIGLRAVNWLWAIGTVEQLRPLEPSLRRAVTRSLQSHGRHIAANLEGSPLLRSNHYLADMLGLLALGAWLEADPDAKGWFEFSQRELERQISSQVLRDGVGFEASLPYHGLALEMFLLAWKISELAGQPMSGRFRSRLLRMLDVSRSVRHPSGRSPIFGDQDSGRVLPAGFRRPATQDQLLDLGSALLDLPPLFAAPHPHEEVAWTLGLSSWSGLLERRRRVTPPPPQNTFPDGGLYVLRHADVHLVARWGDVGQNGNGGHGHNDLGSYELSYGTPVVVDSGTYVYTADPAARDTFRSAEAHNVLVVDGRDMHPLPRGMPFYMPQKAWFRVDGWEDSSDGAVLSGRHDGYSEQASVIVCRRRFTLTRSTRVIEIRDEVEGHGLHHLESLVHLAAGCQVDRIGPLALAVRAGEQQLEFTVDGAQTVTVEDAWISSQYGVRDRAPVIRAVADHGLPSRVTYRIVPQ